MSAAGRQEVGAIRGVLEVLDFLMACQKKFWPVSGAARRASALAAAGADASVADGRRPNTATGDGRRGDEASRPKIEADGRQRSTVPTQTFFAPVIALRGKREGFSLGSWLQSSSRRCMQTPDRSSSFSSPRGASAHHR
jgi:hypothetical protein